MRQSAPGRPSGLRRDERLKRKLRFIFAATGKGCPVEFCVIEGEREFREVFGCRKLSVAATTRHKQTSLAVLVCALLSFCRQ